MSRTWLISDTHFGHQKCWETFKRSDGYPLRPFSSTEEMDKTMINNWNSVVNNEDRVYHVGDVAIGRKSLGILSQLKGRKCLIKGNHDIFKLNDYVPYFDDIRAYVVKKTKEGGKLIIAHVPLHKDCIGRFGKQIHGHLHSNHINDPAYLNISVEQINFMPISLDECLKRFDENETEFKKSGKIVDYSERYLKR